MMEDKNNVILTEDGQRLTVENGAITGTDDSGPGLGRETGSTILNDGNNLSQSESDNVKDDDSKEGK